MDESEAEMLAPRTADVQVGTVGPPELERLSSQAGALLPDHSLV